MSSTSIPTRPGKDGTSDKSGHSAKAVATLTPADLPYAITGIPTDRGINGEVPIRMECDAWTSSNQPVHLEQKNLFLLALRFYVDMDPLDRDSFWQTAGIHGLPYMPWNESSLPQSVPVVGYCTHNSTLFPSWHRPYVTLFEQRIYEIMVNKIIPDDMPEDQTTQDSLKAAAKAWRFPYWDWAAHNEVPILCQNQSVGVYTKAGPATIKNPMYQYDLPPGKTFGTMGPPSNQNYVLRSADGFAWELPIATGRCAPSFQEDAIAFQAGTVNNGQVATNIRNHDWYSESIDDPTLKDSVHRLLTYPVDYEVFATTNMNPVDAASNPLGYLNCEYIHNNVHNWIGGDSGQMNDVPVAAYDPIFFLHHCNIDRLYAIWQSLNPNKWFRVNEVFMDDGTWSIGTSKPDTQCTQLAPFRPNTSGAYYTPDTVRDWMQQFGYSYPELQPWNYATNEEYIDSINAAIATLYGSLKVSVLDSIPKSKDAYGGIVFHRSDLPKKTVTHYDYVVNVRYGKYDLGGLPYKIDIFLRRHSARAHADPSPQKLHQPPSLEGTSFIGDVYNFSTTTGPQGTNAHCPNCAAQQKSTETSSNAQIPITAMLMKAAGDDSWPVNTIAPEGDDGVVRFLQGRLTWKVSKKGGEEVPITSLPNLKVSVAVGTITHAGDVGRGDHRPATYHGYLTRHSITHGYLGGLQHGEAY
ncbi:MAG: hypothetical protein M1813_004716 [Trichoglossum hirsutum]|nr:MAG: hypothetical protein M1813_004716 [Trichoglossum hirsutum]